MKIGNLLRWAKGKTVKYSPELLAGGGAVLLITAGVVACFQTRKAIKVKEQKEDILKQIDEMEENGLADENVEFTPEMAVVERRKAKVSAAIDYVKLYSIPVGLATGGVACIVFGTRILRKRNGILVAAYTALDRSFKEYRKRVQERFGEEIDKQLRFGATPVEEKEKVKDEDGKTRTLKTSRDVVYNLPKEYSDYARMYDDGCNGWSKNPEDSRIFLNREQRHFTEELVARTTFDENGNVKKPGVVTLNEVYDALGIPRSKTGQFVGWAYVPTDKNRDCYIDFGIYDVSKPKNGDFINGYETAIILDFNVDGLILDFI
jgi:hypothetical protein